MGLDVLRQDGILGIFPEGGTWDPAQMQAQSGIAWLSYKAKAPHTAYRVWGDQRRVAKSIFSQTPASQRQYWQTHAPGHN